ncbi:hypothetical protein [Streptococcus devriesei]|nr:hypothetical protein [Streptococcus devriesei]
MTELKKMEEIFEKLDEQDMSEIVGGRSWVYDIGAFGRYFNQVSLNIGL